MAINGIMDGEWMVEPACGDFFFVSTDGKGYGW